MRVKIQLLVLFIPLVFGGLASSVSADDVQISNDVHVSASAGGNSGANVTTGGASVNVSIHSSVNGTPLLPVDIVTTSLSGEARVDVQNDFTSGTPSSSVQVQLGNGAPHVFWGFPTGTPPIASSGLPRIFRQKPSVHAVSTSTPTSTVPAPQFHRSFSSTTGTSTQSHGFLGEFPHLADSLLRSIWNGLGSIFKF